MAIGVHLVATLILTWPALTGQLLLNPRSDQFIAGYAFREFARQQFVETGAIPQWNPYLFGGLPFVDAMHGDTFYPTALLRLLLGTGAGMTWGMVLHIFLAGCFTWLFLRSIGVSFLAALVGGVAYQMGGNIAGLVSPGHDGKLFVATMLPLALYFVVRGVRDGRAWAWGPLAGAIGLAVLSPHPQLLQYMLLVTGALALFLALGWDGSAPAGGRAARLRRLAPALGAVGVGMVMGAIQFWPVRTYTPWSPRAGGKGWEHAISYSMPPEETINFALPQFSGILENYWGRNGIHFHSEYLGVVVLVLATLAFGGRAGAGSRRYVAFFGVTLVVALLWAMGGFTPFYHLVYALVPGTKYFRAPSTMLFVVAFATSVLAAFGAEQVLRGDTRRRTLAGICGALAILGLLALSGLLTNSALSINGARGDAIVANEPALKAGALRLLMFVVLSAVLVSLTGARRLSRDLAGAALVALVAADLWSVLRLYMQFAPAAATLYAADDMTKYLQQQPGPFRVVTLPPSTGNPRDVNLVGDGLMSHGIPVALGYHGNQIGKYDLLSGAPEYRQLGNPNFWKLANIRFFMGDSPDFPLEGATRVLGPVRNNAGNDVYLHRMPGESHYAWVTTAMVKAGDDAAAATVLDPRFDVRTLAIFDSSAAITGVNVTSLPPAATVAARVLAWSPGSATLELEAPAPPGSALVVSENYYPGWRATVDGKPATVGRTNVSLIGVALPDGARKVELSFVNEPYVTGRLVTWLAIGAALAWWIGGLLVSRRQAVASA